MITINSTEWFGIYSFLKFKIEVQIQMQKKQEEIDTPLPKENYICIAYVQTVNSGAKILNRSVAQRQCEEK